MNIENKIIGHGAPVYIIAEAGVAHFGDLGKAVALVDLAADGGADTFKTQVFTANTLISARLSEWRDRVAGLSERAWTRLGSRAVRISGRERQRIAIARALYRRPDVLLLDEATGALDSTTEQVIFRSLEELRGRITMAIISHRMSAVSICDQVLLLDARHFKMDGIYSDVLRRHPASA